MSGSPGSVIDRGLTFVRSFARRTGRILLTGFMIIVPFVVMLFLFDIALGFVRQGLQPLVAFLQWTGVVRRVNFQVIGPTRIDLGLYGNILGYISELVAVVVLLGVIVVLGVFGSFRSGERVVEYMDAGVGTIPGIGPVYKSLRRMGNVVLERGVEDFRSVKLVEFPHEGLYSLAFETNSAPNSVHESVHANDEDADGTDIVTLFVPLAPNPVMGGFLIHASRDRILDVDMTVEEAARALVTSGIAAGDADGGTAQSSNPVRGFGAAERVTFSDIPDWVDLTDEPTVEGG